MARAKLDLFSPDPPELFPVPMTGEVLETVSVQAPGRVQFQASSWPARLYQVGKTTALLPKQKVLVLGREGIVLLVQEA